MPNPPPPSNTLTSTLTTVHDLYTTYILPRLPTPLQSIMSTLDPFPLLTSLLQTGDIVSLAAFLVVAYISLRVADYIRRSIFGWVVFFMKIGLLLLLVQAALYVQAYGWERALRDAGWVGGWAWGLLEEILEGGQQNQSQNQQRARSRAGPAAGWNVAGGRQQVPVGRGGTKRRGGWS